jgi:CRISPR-associated protein Cmr1
MKQDCEHIEKAIALINLYGTLGGRSRNGWGSFVLESLGETPSLSSSYAVPLRLWTDSLNLDWPHAIGRDERRPLVWQTEAFSNWQAAMTRLAEIKIGLRTQPPFKFFGGDAPQPRHWLAYPVTRHTVKAWEGDRHHPPLRLPNTLRFKLRSDRADSGNLRGIIFHVPCMPPADFRPNRRDIETVWKQVQAFLDRPEQKLSRIAA